jgi:hypothetical protein
MSTSRCSVGQAAGRIAFNVHGDLPAQVQADALQVRLQVG